MAKKQVDEKLKTSIGGQALLEGIMMRGPKKTAIAVRGTDGEITIETEPTSAGPKGAAKIPILRGVVNFVFSMICGYKALMRSAELCGLEDLIDEDEMPPESGEAEECETVGTDEKNDIPAPVNEDSVDHDTEKREIKEEKKKETGKETQKDKGSIGGGTMTAIIVVSIVLGLALALFLFKFIPETIYELLTRAFPGMRGEGYGYNLLRAAITGVMKILILVGYMAAVSLMKDIRRTFMYHGAEHKSIFCYEKGLELTVENVRRQRRFHPRCGTSFLILMVLVSILVSMFIPAQVTEGRILNIFARTGIGILLLPIIMGIGYELIKFAGRHDNVVTRVISAPGMWLQHITTREPDDDMIECAIAALKEVIPDDGSDKW
ncbi:MAG: DUF1385 domain-containing protein [Clostridia bacterium]|nr:DUF1385 domain-containing protein [Clostridia bacterium]